MSLRQAARDARAVIEQLGLERVTVVGWSMGTSLIHPYFDLFGAERLKGAVFIDMTPRLVNDGGWEHGVFGPWTTPRPTPWSGTSSKTG